MKHEEVSSIVVIGLLLLIAGLTWLFCPWALVGSGAVLLLVSFFINVRED